MSIESASDEIQTLRTRAGSLQQEAIKLLGMADLLETYARKHFGAEFSINTGNGADRQLNIGAPQLPTLGAVSGTLGKTSAKRGPKAGTSRQATGGTRGPRSRITDEQKAQIRELAAANLNPAEISRKTGVNYGSVRNYLLKNEGGPSNGSIGQQAEAD